MGVGREVSIYLDGVRDKNVMQEAQHSPLPHPLQRQVLRRRHLLRRLHPPRSLNVFGELLFHRLDSALREMTVSGCLTTELAEDIYHDPNAFFFVRFPCSCCMNHLNAYYSDICVGSIACRLEKKEGGAICVYIMTLGVLALYRELGIGTRLLNHALNLCIKQSISEIYLHVQTNHEDAINFYKKFGFEITDTIQNYYTNIVPPDCYVLTKSFSPPQAKK